VVAGWFPLVGTISGFARGIFTYLLYKGMEKKNSGRFQPETKSFFAIMVMRTVVEMSSSGFLLALPDLIITIGRKIALSERPQSLTSSRLAA